MKSRPIIFSAPMVRAILTGQKTQTRRVVKGVPASHAWAGFVLESTDSKQDGKAFFGIQKSEYHYDQIVYVRCPYGVVGDRIWVREGYADILWNITASGKEIRRFIYKADEQHGATIIHPTWKTPLFMPLAASRIELEITGIRVERVQDITDADALAEGVEVCEVERGLSAEEEYSVLWTEIHGYHDQKGWNANPWVWVIEFKHVGGTQ